MSLENVVKKTVLLDCYGLLLTARQRECLELYYNENLTLAEIATHFDISRQAVHDAMRHGEEQLEAYEKILRLSENDRVRMEAVRRLKALLPSDVMDKAEPLLELLTGGK